jgi:glycosyltransferase involved in cell wall biosynthesis
MSISKHSERQTRSIDVKPTISIVTPTFNAMDYLEICVESVRSQDSRGAAVEHVIVDGGSTDGTVEFARSCGLTVLQGKDKGIFDAMNKGYLAAKGELIGFLGADDMWVDGALQAVASCYEQYPDAKWFVGGVKIIDGQGKDMGDIAAPPRWMTAEILACLGWSTLHHVSTFVTPAFFRELGGFNLEYNVAADYEIFCRARVRAPYARIPRPVGCNRQTGQNFSAVHGRRAWEQSQRVQQTVGPKSTIKRMLYKRLMQLWVYGHDPRWAVRKRVAEGRIPLLRSRRMA